MRGIYGVCPFCRATAKHLPSCPQDDLVSMLIWREGYKKGLAGEANIHSECSIFTLGYEAGDADLRGYCTPPVAFQPVSVTCEPRSAPRGPTAAQITFEQQKRELRRREADLY